MLRRIGLIDIFGVLVGAVLILVTETFVGDPGVGWHLKTGEWIVANRRVPTTDPFLFPSEGKQWICEQWLADVLSYLGFRAGGFPLLHLLFVGLVLSIYVFVLHPLLRQVSQSNLTAFFLTLLASLLGAVQWIFRPVVLSFLFFSLIWSLAYPWYLGLPAQHSSRKKLFIMLPGIFLLWANIHPAFPLGWCLLGCLTLGCYFQQGKPPVKDCLLLLLCCVLVTFVTPNGLSLYKSILGLVGDGYFMNLNTEWFSVDYHGRSFLPFFIVFLLVYLIIGRRLAVGLFELLMLMIFSYLALQQRRYLPFYGITVSVVLAKLLADTKVMGPRFPKLAQALRSIARKDEVASRGEYSFIAWGGLVVFTLVSGYLPLRSGREPTFPTNYPKAAVARLATEQNVGRIFHTPDWGGYLTFSLWPRTKAFIDDRNQLNSRMMYEDFFTADRAKPGWQEVLSRWEFNWILVQIDAPLAVVLKEDERWEEVLEQDGARLFQKRKNEER